MGQLMVIGKTVRTQGVPTLKGTEVLSYVQCFLYLVSSINVSVSYYMAGYFLHRSHMCVCVCVCVVLSCFLLTVDPST